MSNQIDLFLDTLIAKRFAGETLEAEIKDELKQDAREQLDDLLLTRTIEEFADEDAETFDQMVTEKKSREELQQFAATHITDYQTFVTDCLKDFTDGYLL